MSSFLNSKRMRHTSRVTCGFYAAVSVMLLDQIPKGAYYVDELLLKTDNHYGDYLTYYMRDFVCRGESAVRGVIAPTDENAFAIKC